MTQKAQRVCPVEEAGSLDSRFRNWLHNPKKILRNYISGKMVVMDTGCGPGFFTIEMAKMLDNGGKVIAVDLQKGMLDIVKAKRDSNKLNDKIELHLCREDSLAISRNIDLAFVFYAVHEHPNQKKLFAEIHENLKPGGKMFIAEPKFHVKKRDFNTMLTIIEKQGFRIVEHPRVFFSHAVVAQK